MLLFNLVRWAGSSFLSLLQTSCLPSVPLDLQAWKFSSQKPQALYIGFFPLKKMPRPGKHWYMRLTDNVDWGPLWQATVLKCQVMPTCLLGSWGRHADGSHFLDQVPYGISVWKTDVLPWTLSGCFENEPMFFIPWIPNHISFQIKLNSHSWGPSTRPY